MAESKPIQSEQIAEKNLLTPLKKEFEELDDILKGTAKSLKEIVSESAKIAKQTPLDSYENIEKVEKGILEATKAVSELDKVEKDRLKLQAKIKELDDDRIKVNFELKEQIRLQTKALRDNAKASKETGDAYAELKRATNQAQLEAKKLAVQFGENSDQAKEAIDKFEKLDDQLDSVNKRMRDGRRSVGLYEKGTQRLTKAFKAFASATIILKALELLQNSISQNSEGAAELEKIWVRVTTVIEVFARRSVDVFPIVAAKFERFVLSVQIGVGKITDLFGKNERETDKLESRYKELEELAGKDLGKAFGNLGNEIEDLTSKKVALIDKTLEYRKEIALLDQGIAESIPTREKYRAQLDDDSKSLENQLEGGLKYLEVTQEIFLVEEKISAKRLKLAQDNAKANSVNVASQEELALATREYNELIGAQAAEIAASEIQINKIRSDITELNLDFYVDDAQNRIDTNQRIIDDDTQTFARRRELLIENDRERRGANKLRAKELNKTLKRMGEDELDFEDLRKKNSSEEIARVVKESGLSEQLSIRVLEIIRERRTELQDSADAQRDLNDAEAESLRLQDDIALQKEALNRLDKEGIDLQMVLEELSKQRLKSDIDNLNERILLAEEGSARFISLNKELNDKLLEQDQANFDKRKQELEKYSKATTAAFQIISDLNSKRNEKRLSEIDDEISAEEARVSTLQALAAEGNEDAENNIAVTEKRQAELELQREQQLKRQKQSELALTAIQTYSGKVTNGDSNPLASTISDISVLRTFISALPAFYEGSEMVGNDLTPVMSGRDGHVIRVDGSERVLTGEQNKLIGNMSNNELANMAYKSQKKGESTIGTNVIIQELRELKTATKNKPSYMGSDIDNISGMITHRIKTGNKLETRHVKQGGIWG